MTFHLPLPIVLSTHPLWSRSSIALKRASSASRGMNCLFIRSTMAW
jgi:hypothetical protein